MGGKAWVAGATNKELRDSDGREMVSAPGPEDASVGIAGSFAEGVQEEAKEKSPLRHYLAYPDNSKSGSIN